MSHALTVRAVALAAVVFAFAGVLPAVACSAGIAAPDAPGSNEGGTEGSVPTDGGGPVDPRCPLAVPPAGSSCMPVLSCTYPSGPHGSCTVTASCASQSANGPFTWFVSKPSATCGGNKAECPATYTSLPEKSACPGPSDTLCDYTEGRCACTPCSPDGGSGPSASEWVCRKWTDVPAGCPTDDIPALGGSCSKEGLTCDYSGRCGTVSLGGSFTCQGGTWTQGPIAAGSCILLVCGK